MQAYLRQVASPPAHTWLPVAQVVDFDLDGVPFSAKLIDCPGYGDTLDLRHSISFTTRYLDRCFRRSFTHERQIRRADLPPLRHLCVDVVLYFIAPHRLKAADLAFLRCLKSRTSIIPLLAKADSMTAEELAAFRQVSVSPSRVAGRG